jgi:hypothetical protein
LIAAWAEGAPPNTAGFQVSKWLTSKLAILPQEQIEVIPVEVNHADLAVCRINGSQNGQYNGVVTSKSDDSRVILAIKRDRDQRLACDGVVAQRGEGWALKERFMAMFYLLDGMLIVIRGDRNVSYKSINIKRHFSIA